MKHLWEIEHSYYCSEVNYYDRECYNEYETFEEFLEVWGHHDLDMNMIFRFDWRTHEWVGEEEPERLDLFYMLQRKGVFICNSIKIKREDEPKVIEFLKPRFEYMMNLWKPFEKEDLNE